MPPKRKNASNSNASTKRPKNSSAPALDFGTDSSDSDSDDLSDSDSDEDEYNPEELILNEDDANYLEGLGEVEREAILADRYEKRQAEKEEEKAIKEQKRLMKESKGNKKKAKKKKVIVEESEEEEEAEDEEDDAEEEEEEEHVEDDDDQGSDEEADADQGASEPAEEETAQPNVTFEELRDSKVIIKRNKLAMWLSEPFFKKLEGFYVRMGIGNDPQTNKPCYRICKVVGFEKTNPYKLPQSAFKKVIMTDIRLILEIGNDKKSFRMSQISNDPISAEDYSIWSKRLIGQRIAVPTFREIKRLKKRIDKIVNEYVATEEEIKQQIEDKAKLKPDAVLNVALKIEALKTDVIRHSDALGEAKVKLEKLKKANPRVDVDNMDLEDDVNDDSAHSALAEIRKVLQDAKKASSDHSSAKASLSKLVQANSVRTADHALDEKVKGWASINAKARKNNKAADYNTFKDKKELEKKKGGKQEEYNPFARRPNKPKMLWAVGDSKKGERVTTYGEVKESKEGEEGEEAAALQVDHEGSQGEAKVAALSHQFSVNVDDVEAEEASLRKEQAKQNDETRERKGMSLVDYLKLKRAKRKLG
eukprot:CAMPEP_0182503518 /NCGR_PEP_ID=MMETSP1321-20130603/15445_1 /TAXON_ID=91990 /ORGANISM="Bolidomonas sp., Strain RCC1657" /LENGTH=590 /DNA_ID=CAMNT_0024708693 /DNA_START=130 /DNA_END=1899 /DNA_ORIENTATION=-